MRPLVLIVLLTGSALGAQQPTRLADHAGTGPAFFTRSSGGRKRIDARGAAVLERRVAMHLAPGTVGEALDTLAAQAGLHIAYSPRVVDLTAHVSLQADDISVGAVLTDILMGSRIDVEVVGGDQVLLVPEVTRHQPAVRHARGRVLDRATGGPVAAAQVLVAGTAVTTASSDSGTFALVLPPGATTLTVRRIGYLQATVPIPADTSEIVVSLEKDVLRLDAMVVTGVVTSISAANAANDVAVLGAEDVSRVPAPTVENALQGKIPGALIEQNNGGAPGGGMQIQVRGITSIYANAQPLYVVDGIMINNGTVNSGLNTISHSEGGVGPSQQDNSPNRVADLNPSDIESIEVLKGASASAIYGSKASSGVIIITTKRGSNGAARWSASQSVGHFALANRYGLRTFPTLASAIAWGRSFGVDSGFIATTYAGPQDYQSQLFGNREASYQSDLSVGGTSGHTQYFLSGMTKYDNGILTNTGYNKQTVRSNVTQGLGGALSVSANLLYANSTTRRGVTGNDNIGISPYDVFSYTPQFVTLGRRPDGSWPINPFGPANPFADAVEIQTPEYVNRFVGGGTVDWRPYQSANQALRVTLIGGTDLTTQQDKFYAPPDLQVEQQIPTGLPGVAQDQYGKTTHINYSLNVVHHYAASRQLDATTSIGYVRERRTLDQPLAAGRALLAGTNNPTVGAIQTVGYDATDSRDQSVYAQEQLLLFGERAALTGGVTAERTTNDGRIGKYYPYTRFSGSYRFPSLLRGVDELKLRAAYGQSGTQPDYGVKYTPFNIGVSDGGVGAYLPLLLGDSAVKPERETEIETGLDATLLGSRAVLGVTVYQKRLTDLLLLAAPAPSLGYDLQWINGGEFTNQGIEVRLEATPIQTRSVQWVTTTSFYRNYSVVNSLPVPNFNFNGTALYGTYRIQVGRSVSQIVGNRPGADGQPVQVGDGQPSFVMNFANEVTLGPVRGSAVVQWNRGGNTSNFTDFLYDIGPGLLADTTLTSRRIAQLNANGTPYLESGGFVKLREVALRYTVPIGWLKWTGGRISNAALSLTGRNLLMWTGYLGLDPEVTYIGPQQVARGQDVTPYPPARSYFLSLDLSF